MFWFRKFAAVVSISVGFALLVLPFPPVLAGERTVQVLNLEVAPAPFTAETARAELGERFVALTSEELAWQEVERVRLREQRNPFAFTVFDFRRLQKVLDLEGATGTLMTINEPSSRVRKRRLLDALRQYAPERITSPIAGLEGTW